MWADDADARGADEDSVLIVARARLVAVVMRAELDRVTFGERVLAEDVGDIDLLIAEFDFAEVDRVQLTVGLFFEHVEIGKVVLPPVRRDVAEHPHAKVRVAEDEAAEIAGELLNAHAHRARIEERGAPLLTPFAAQERQYFCRIAKTQFGKHLLDGVEAAQTRFAFAHINVDDAIFTRSQKIDVRDAGDLKPPVNRFERSVAFEEIEREDE